MRLYIIIAVVVALTLVPTLILDDEIDAAFAGEAGLERLRSFGAWAWLVGIGLIVSDLVLPVPSTAVISGLGMLYGPWLGGLVGGIGSTAAGLVAYSVGRWIGGPALRLFIGPEEMARLPRFFARHGLWAIAVSRWMPLLPEALCALAGTAHMRILPFLAALSCGSFAMGFAFGFLGVYYVDRPVAGLLISALVPLVIWPIVHYCLRRQPIIETSEPVATPHAELEFTN
jgi:uncharacterized membrane protein YdjX (TVP38/TMEM64 family)